MNLKEEEQFFLDLLEKEYTWPDYYTFRFICSDNEIDQLLIVLEELSDVEHFQSKDSSGKHFKSISFRILINNSNEIVAVYRHISKIKGIIRI